MAIISYLEHFSLENKNIELCTAEIKYLGCPDLKDKSKIVVNNDNERVFTFSNFIDFKIETNGTRQAISLDKQAHVVVCVCVNNSVMQIV